MTDDSTKTINQKRGGRTGTSRESVDKVLPVLCDSVDLSVTEETYQDMTESSLLQYNYFPYGETIGRSSPTPELQLMQHSTSLHFPEEPTYKSLKKTIGIQSTKSLQLCYNQPKLTRTSNSTPTLRDVADATTLFDNSFFTSTMTSNDETLQGSHFDQGLGLADSDSQDIIPVRSQNTPLAIESLSGFGLEYLPEDQYIKWPGCETTTPALEQAKSLEAPPEEMQEKVKTRQKLQPMKQQPKSAAPSNFEKKFTGSIVNTCLTPKSARNIIVPIDKNKLTSRDIDLIFNEIIHEGALFMVMMSHCGNFIIQRLIPHLTQSQVLRCLDLVTGTMENYLVLSQNAYATRCVQEFLIKSLQFIHEAECIRLVKKALRYIEKNTTIFFYDKIAYNVMLKIIETFPVALMETIYDNILSSIRPMCLHKIGCIVVKKLFLNVGEYRERILDAIVEDIVLYSENEFGNYLIQACIQEYEHGDMITIVDALKPHLYHLCFHRYASNVVEKLIRCVKRETGASLIHMLVERNRIWPLVSNKYGNYVAQVMVEYASDSDRATITRYLERSRMRTKRRSANNG